MASATASVNTLDVCQCLANMAASSAAKIGAASVSAAASIIKFFMESLRDIIGIAKSIAKASRTNRMTRRELAKLAAAGGATLLPTGPSAGRAAPADDSQGNAGSVYGGPLEGFADKVDADAFDPVLYT